MDASRLREKLLLHPDPGEARLFSLALASVEGLPEARDALLAEIERRLSSSTAIAAGEVGAPPPSVLTGAISSEGADQLLRLYASTPAMLHTIDLEGRFLTVSDRWLSVMGYEREEIIGRHVTDLHTEASRRRAASSGLPSLFRDGLCDGFEVELVTKSGEVLHVLLSAVLERDARGRPRRGLVVTHDLTARTRAERALAAERARLVAIVESTAAATWEWNVETGATRTNDHFDDRYEPVVVPLAAWPPSAHGDDVDAARAAVREHLDGARDAYELDLRVRHRDGTWRWVHERGRVMSRTAQGAPEWMFGTRVDITERKAAEDELRRRAELLDAVGALADVGGWSLDLSTRVLSWTSATKRIHGVDERYVPVLEEAIAFYAPEVRPLVERAVAHAIETGEPWDLELPLIQRSGRRIWVRAAGRAVHEGDVTVALLGAFQDVTQLVEQRRALEAEHQRLVLATGSGRIGIWDCDLVAGSAVFDAAMCRLYGLPEQPIADTAAFWDAHLHPDDREAALRAAAAAVEGAAPFDTEFRILAADGVQRHLRATATITRDAAGRAVRMVGVSWDVTELRQLGNQLAEQHEMLRVTLESIAEAIITTDGLGRVTWMNPVAERMTGWSTLEAKGRDASEIFHIVREDSRDAADSSVRRCLAEHRVVGFTRGAVLVGRDGTEHAIEESAAPIRSARGDVLGVVVVFRDVTEERRLSGEMAWHARHDALTGLINRTELEARLRDVLAEPAEATARALLFVDLDQFKLVNATMGHAVGDQLLQAVTQTLVDCLDARDTIARVGGDEFAILLERRTVDETQAVGQAICERMDAFRFAHGERRVRIGASVGLVPMDGRLDDVALLLQAADQACAAAKDAGRNRVHAWRDADLAMKARHGHTEWATRLSQALDENRFALFAQRICPLDGAARGIHAEVLLRLVDEGGRLVSPGAFLPAAERYFLAPRVDRWVLRNVVLLLGADGGAPGVETLSVNVSGQSMGDRQFHREAVEILSEAGPEVCKRLCLEITETAAVTSLADAAAFAKRVRQLGVRVALDDFGAGASSFSYLKSLPVDFLKIDGQFVRDLEDPIHLAAIRCFVEVAGVVGLATVAEFVEKPEALAQLQRMGVDYAQGYLLHEPEPIGAVLRAARERAA